MISAPENVQPHTRRYASNDIEAVSTTLLLADNTNPNSTVVQITWYALTNQC